MHRVHIFGEFNFKEMLLDKVKIQMSYFKMIFSHCAYFEISDCHAEIVSRRCLLSFFYSQLEKFANSENENENIFEPLDV